MKRGQFVALGIFIVVGLFAAYNWTERGGYRNLIVCRTLSPGITLADLARKLGTPIASWKVRNEEWLAFETPSIMAGMIKAQVDGKKGKVLALHCSADAPPTWTVTE